MSRSCTGSGQNGPENLPLPCAADRLCTNAAICAGTCVTMTDMAENPADAWTDIYWLRDYNPYTFMGQRNPAFRKDSDGRLLDLKDNLDHGVTAAAEDFKEGLDRLELPSGTVLVVVPGHEARESNEGRPLARVAHTLAESDDRYIASVDSLTRVRTVLKKTQGGNRSTTVELNSIRVNNPTSLEGSLVVVLDDTSTTGGSLKAARLRLEDAGAKKVAAVALGRTVKYL